MVVLKSVSLIHSLDDAIGSEEEPIENEDDAGLANEEDAPETEDE
jgi:hypothetical protein